MGQTKNLMYTLYNSSVISSSSCHADVIKGKKATKHCLCLEPWYKNSGRFTNIIPHYSLLLALTVRVLISYLMLRGLNLMIDSWPCNFVMWCTRAQRPISLHSERSGQCWVHFLSIKSPAKSFISVSEFDSLSLITFWTFTRAAWLIYFISM